MATKKTTTSKKKPAASKSTTKPKGGAAKKKTTKPDPSLKLYRRIAIIFTSVTFALLLLVLYFSFTRATIVIHPVEQMVESEFITDVLPAPDQEYDLPGIVVSSVFEQAKEQVVDGTDVRTEPAKAGGLVTIINTHSSDQPLVETTRLLTPDNILFRIDETVLVPAGGTVEVMAYADEAGLAGEIGPSSFTIPGLSQSLQEKIYAESSEAFTGGEATIKTITQDDLDAAGAALEDEIMNAAMETLRLEAGDTYSGEAFFAQVLERKSDTEIGEEAESVTISLTIDIVGVFFQEEGLLDLAERKLYEELPAGMELIENDEMAFDLEMNEDEMCIDWNLGQICYQILDYNVDAQMANMQISAMGSAALSPTNILLDKQAFLGASPSSVEERLNAEEVIEKAEVNVTPFWLNRLPSLQDHIRINIRD